MIERSSQRDLKKLSKGGVMSREVRCKLLARNDLEVRVGINHATAVHLSECAHFQAFVKHYRFNALNYSDKVASAISP